VKKKAGFVVIVIVFVGIFGFIMIDSPNAFDEYESGEYLESADRFKGLQSKAGDYNAANAYYKAGEYEKALLLYQNIRSSDPLFKSMLYFNMANSFIRLQEFEKAREHFRFSLILHYDKEAVENLHFIASAEEQDHMLSGRQKGKKAKSDPRLSFSPKGKSRLSSRQYELINSRSIYETQPW